MGLCPYCLLIFYCSVTKYSKCSNVNSLHTHCFTVSTLEESRQRFTGSQTSTLRGSQSMFSSENPCPINSGCWQVNLLAAFWLWVPGATGCWGKVTRLLVVPVFPMALSDISRHGCWLLQNQQENFSLWFTKTESYTVYQNHKSDIPYPLALSHSVS
jgi:hypothetical protein